MRRKLNGLALLAAALAGGEAGACLTREAETALIHNSVPADLDPRLVVAEVDILTLMPSRVHSTGGAAEVRRMIQGPKEEDFLDLRVANTSCSHPFRNGRSGIIIGVPIGRQNGILVLNAIEVSALGGFRLPDNYRAPEKFSTMSGTRPAFQ